MERKMGMRIIRLFAGILGILSFAARASLPMVGIHDSELTRTLETLPASATTPTGAGTTGFEWWPVEWHYFVMPESLKEALRSDGTLFAVVKDADISNGGLLDGNGAPKYPIVISLAAEAISDAEIQPLLNYVTAGGTLFVGSSAFTRSTDGKTRGDFAIASAMGVHMAKAGLTNWTANYKFGLQTANRLVAHIPTGVLNWWLPSAADEISWGISPTHIYSGQYLAWNVTASDAQVIAQDDSGPALLIKNYGKGRFIYYSVMEPLIGHGGWAPGMYSYVIFRESIQWAFESLGMPVPRLSPWPYAYNAAFNIRHDFENDQTAINGIEASAQAENALGAKGDYYFCTGALRVDMGNSSTTINSLKRAVTNYHASIGPHNGGLPNPNNPALTNANFDYWHWGPDEALDVTPSGYAIGNAYALTSLTNAYQDVEGWLSGLNNANGLRIWASPYFNSTREGSYALLQQLGVVTAGEEKLTPFPHWTVSTQTSGKRYSFLNLPVSDWYVGTQIAQAMEYHTSATMHAAVDYYYNLGALINIYGHSVSSTGLENDYLKYCAAKPNIWSANATDVYSWWLKRSAVQVTPSYTTNGGQTVITLAISGATDPQTAVELWIPQTVFAGLAVRLNGTLASANQFRVDGQRVRVLAGNTINTVEIRYNSQLFALNDAYTTNAGQTLTVASPGVLANDTSVSGTNLTAVLMTTASNGTLSLATNGGFTYTPLAGFSGTDTFTYMANDGQSNSNPATVSITVNALANQPPTVSLTSPANGATYTAPANITLTATASDSDGTISKVEFYNGATLLATDTVSPYSFAWNSVASGTYSLTARAYDNTGASTTSGTAVVKVIAAVNQPPTVSLTSPANGANFTPPATVTLSATASDSDGTITKVEFYSGSTLLATDTTSPYSVTFTGVLAGTYFVSARAYDNAGASTTSGTAVVTVGTVVNQPPTVNLTGPVNGATYTAPANITLTATASDSDGTISKVEFYNGSTLLGQSTASPYSFAWNSVASGTYNLTARAYDNTGASTTSGTATITVSGTSLFTDDFSQNAVSPWNPVLGTWTATSGALHGTSSVQNYGYASYSTTWTDYTLQGRVQFPTGAYGGGLGGRLNASTGAHYGAWVYPEGSSGGSAVLKLVKFRTWTTWSGTTMKQVSLSSVGTGWHTLKLTFQGSRILVYYDGTLVMDVTDNSFDSRAAYLSGGITADLWTDKTTYTMNVDDILVTP